MKWNVQPHIIVKLRKQFLILGLTKLTVGADYDFRTRQTMVKWSWMDRTFGARLHINSREFALTKSFNVDKQTRLDVRAALDLHRLRTLLSVRVRPFGRVVADPNDPGLCVRQRVPLDEKLSVEYAARVRLPEARFVADSRFPLSFGDGNFVIDVDELNFRVFLK